MDPFTKERGVVIAPLRPVDVEELPVEAAEGRFLAEEVRAALPVPRDRCSAMDGYAVRASEVADPWALEVRRVIYAGDPAGPALSLGEAVRVFTGAHLPEGADAVVRQEEVDEQGGRAVFSSAVLPGENVRPQGEDVTTGGLVLPAGARLCSRQRALLCAAGVQKVRVRRRPRVLLVSTGDELVAGRTPDSSGLAVAGLLEAEGAVVERACLPDRPEEIRFALERAAADLTLTIGGLSVGDRDWVPEALAALGADVRLQGVRMRPGKPFLFALLGSRPILALPGSPSACLVAFEVFARPALLALSGAARILRPAVPVRLAGRVEGHADRARLVWASLVAEGRALPLPRGSGQVRGPALADALLVLPAGTCEIPEGGEAIAWLLGDG